eukprot:7808461-Lingulodinium_polyedra.AAC.1
MLSCSNRRTPDNEGGGLEVVMTVMMCSWDRLLKALARCRNMGCDLQGVRLMCTCRNIGETYMHMITWGESCKHRKHVITLQW